MKKIILLSILLILAVLVMFVSGNRQKASEVQTVSAANWWEIQSVDTMKYSRDVARQGLTDPAMPGIIEEHVSEIATVGATHIALATPYDEEFLPFLRMWVAAARKHDLKIWFRGNWSGWEGWFGYPKISRADHLAKTKQFILSHPDLFENGDIFSACPECENGGPGDPRMDTDVTDYRQFLIDEYQVTRNAFVVIKKNVRSNILSMNADVARLVMDRDTTGKLGGIVTIDHYVKNPGQYADDIDSLVKNTGGRIMLGEFGAPIPDITGAMSPEDQSRWLQQVLTILASRRTDIIGLSYWVGVGGSTQIWDSQGNASPAVSVLRDFYAPNQKISLAVKNDQNRPVPAVPVSWFGREYRTDKNGRVDIPYLKLDRDYPGPVIGGNGSGYGRVAVSATASATPVPVIVTAEKPGFLDRIRSFFNGLLGF